jgi:hypothetical protein
VTRRRKKKVIRELVNNNGMSLYQTNETLAWLIVREESRVFLPY